MPIPYIDAMRKQNGSNPHDGGADEGPCLYLRERFSYDPDTGILRYKKNVGPRYAGEIAGSLRKDGRLELTVKGIKYQAHYVAWVLFHKALPRGDIDHINGNPVDNRIRNLREATRSQNLGNATYRGKNATGYRGVVKLPNGRFRAVIHVRKKIVRLGRFDTAEAASAAYIAASKKYFGAYSVYCRQDAIADNLPSPNVRRQA